MDTVLELLTTIGRFLVGLWPLMFVTVLVGVFRRRKGFGAMLRTSINALMISWGFFALLNLVFFFLKMDTFRLLPEDVNMKYFLSVGLILLPFEFAILLEERHKKICAHTLEEMRALSPSDFEKLVAETYRDQGHKVEIVGSTGDHGIDLVVRTRKGEVWLVQCKKYRGKVGEPVIRDFYGALRAANADAGAVITTGYITASARLWAEGKPIFLYDGEEFLDVIQTTRIRKSLPVEAKKRPVVNPLAAASLLTPAFAGAHAAAAPVVNNTPVATAPAVSPTISTSVATSYVQAGTTSVVTPVEPTADQDKRPFMNLDDTPVCPACGVPMLLQKQSRLFFKPKQQFICQNAPSCDEVLEVE